VSLNIYYSLTGGRGPNRYSRLCFPRGFVYVKTFINVLETGGPLELTQARRPQQGFNEGWARSRESTLS
jgi:hypothetical protein